LTSLALAALVASCADRTALRAYAGGARPESVVRAPSEPARRPLTLPAWAFARYELSRGDTREALDLRQDGFYSWIVTNGAGVRTREEFGFARLEAGWLVLESELDPGAVGRKPQVTRGAVVAYGVQRCFLRERQVPEFCNVVNGGKRLPSGCMLAPDLDEPNPAPVQATLPPYYSVRVLAKPVVAKVRETRPSFDARPVTNRVEFILDAGAAEGLRSGMQVHVVDVPQGQIAWPGRLIEVHDHWARGRMRSTDYVPTTGTRLTTVDPRVKR
jgi:hypothetical protein